MTEDHFTRVALTAALNLDSQVELIWTAPLAHQQCRMTEFTSLNHLQSEDRVSLPLPKQHGWGWPSPACVASFVVKGTRSATTCISVCPVSTCV